MSALIGGIVVGAAALGKGIYGATQNAKASKIEKMNIRPTETVQNELYQNAATADQMAQTGLPQQQYNNQLNSINRNQASGIQALGSSQNPSGSIQSIVRAGNDASNNLNAEDAMARNKATLLQLQQRGLLANAKQHAFDYNYKDKYSEQLAKSQALRGAASKNITGAIDMAGQAGMAYAGGGFGGSGSSLSNVNGAGMGRGIQSGYTGDTNLTGQFNNYA